MNCTTILIDLVATRVSTFLFYVDPALITSRKMGLEKMVQALPAVRFLVLDAFCIIQ